MSTVPPPAPALPPAPAPIPATADEKMRFLFEKIFEYFERLGVATAVGAGGLAVIYFREKLLPGAGILPGAIGLVLFLAAFFLLVITAAATVQAIFGKRNDVVVGLAMMLTLTVSLLFGRAGFELAAATINPPPPATASVPASAPVQPVKCEGTNLQEKTEPANAGTKAAAPVK